MMRIFLVLIPFIVAKRVAIVSEDIKLGTEEREEEESSDTETADFVDCIIRTRPTTGASTPKGNSGFAKFPVREGQCLTKCVAQVDEDSKTILQQDKRFRDAFDTHYVPTTGKCVCKIGVEPRVEFNAGKLEVSCKDNAAGAKKQCWKTYQKIAALDAEVTGPITTFQADRSFNFNFEVEKSCKLCSGDECKEVYLPPLTTYLTQEKLQTLALQIQEKKASGTLTGILALFDASYTEADKAILIWSSYDTNGDGFLDKTELQSIYGHFTPEKIGRIIAKIDTDSDGKINKEEFVSFNRMALSKWEFHTAEDGTSAILRCVNTVTKDTGMCLTTLEEEISKATGCIN